MIWRIRHRSIFDDLASRGTRVRSGGLRMTFVPRSEPWPLVAFSFGRRFGPAVERNRARRRVRAAFDRAWTERRGPTGAFLLSGSPKLLVVDFEALVSCVESCLDQLARLDGVGPLVTQAEATS